MSLLLLLLLSIVVKICHLLLENLRKDKILKTMIQGTTWSRCLIK